MNIRDLRLGDTGNYSCQVFNSFGLINATFGLDVYEDPTLSTKVKIYKSEFVNVTVNSDMTVSLDCVIENQSNVDKQRTKWMKQITHSEYNDYVANEINAKDTNSNSNNNFLYNAGGLFITKRSVADTLHFITLTSSASIDQKLKFNRKKQIYVNQLVIQKASLKEAGLYVCFLDGQKHGKAELHVQPTNLYLQSGKYQTDMEQYQYLSLLAFLIPVVIVILFSTFSLICLKRMDRSRVSNLFRNIHFCTKDLNKTQDSRGVNNKVITVSSIPTNRDLQAYKMTNSYISECSSVYTPYYTIDPMLVSVPSFFNTSTPAHKNNNDTASTGLHRSSSTPSMVYEKIIEFEG